MKQLKIRPLNKPPLLICLLLTSNILWSQYDTMCFPDELSGTTFHPHIKEWFALPVITENLTTKSTIDNSGATESMLNEKKVKVQENYTIGCQVNFKKYCE